jgi:hypothetical protein
MSSLSADEVYAVKRAYTDAFDDTLVVCSIISGVCVLVTLGCWRRNPPSIREMRQQQFTNEAIRQRALAQLKSGPIDANALETTDGAMA